MCCFSSLCFLLLLMSISFVLGMSVSVSSRIGSVFGGVSWFVKTSV